MQRKCKPKRWLALALVLLLAIGMTACGQPSEGDPEGSSSGGEGEGSSISEDQGVSSIAILGDGIDGEILFTLDEMKAFPEAGFEHIYSTINNWPTAKFYTARGITVESILKEAGVLDTAKVITFRSKDSYEASFTREQLLGVTRYYFPGIVQGSDLGAEEVKPVIAYEHKKGSSDLAEVKADDLCLVIGQANHLEHTNPAFVESVGQIIVSSKEPEQWEAATTFPEAGAIAAGETVKLQHPSLGQVKLFYTLDGSDPTPFSTMYNPSTYQPELNKPIPITENCTIKVLVTGYGKTDSEIAAFEFTVQ